ncbi:MAG: hypothetical protein ACR2F6_03160 [Mycobacteriales bacterium]
MVFAGYVQPKYPDLSGRTLHVARAAGSDVTVLTGSLLDGRPAVCRRLTVPARAVVEVGSACSITPTAGTG